MQCTSLKPPKGWEEQPKKLPFHKQLRKILLSKKYVNFFFCNICKREYFQNPKEKTHHGETNQLEKCQIKTNAIIKTAIIK